MTEALDIFAVRSLERPCGRELWLTSAPHHAQGSGIVNNALEFLAAHNARPVSIRLFGNAADMDAAALSLRSAADEAGCPPLLVLPKNAADPTPLHIQIHAVSGMDSKPLYFKDTVVGRVFEDAWASYYMLTLRPDSPQADGYAQTKNLFENAQQILHSSGLDFSHTIRTWLFADDILSWYAQLNKARNEFFDQHAIYNQLVPASTGIGAANPSGSALTAQLLAVVPKGSDTVIRVANSPLQNSAMNYKSSFSRGIKLLNPDCQRLYISGTASIDAEGNTVFLDDTPAQVDLTMRVVEGILSDAGMGWTDAMSALVYFKHRSDFGLFDDYCHGRKINLPHIKVVADICRDDLLFEVELDAAKKI